MLSLGMVTWGMTVFKNRLEGAQYILYWCVCMGFTVMALLTAALDILVIRLREFRSEKKLLKDVFKDVDGIQLDDDTTEVDELIEKLEGRKTDKDAPADQDEKS